MALNKNNITYMTTTKDKFVVVYDTTVITYDFNLKELNCYSCDSYSVPFIANYDTGITLEILNFYQDYYKIIQYPNQGFINQFSIKSLLVNDKFIGVLKYINGIINLQNIGEYFDRIGPSVGVFKNDSVYFFTIKEINDSYNSHQEIVFNVVNLNNLSFNCINCPTINDPIEEDDLCLFNHNDRVIAIIGCEFFEFDKEFKYLFQHTKKLKISCTIEIRTNNEIITLIFERDGSVFKFINNSFFFLENIGKEIIGGSSIGNRVLCYSSTKLILFNLEHNSIRIIESFIPLLQIEENNN